LTRFVIGPSYGAVLAHSKVPVHHRAAHGVVRINSFTRRVQLCGGMEVDL